MLLPMLQEAWAGDRGDAMQLLVRSAGSALAWGLMHFVLRPVVRRTSIEERLRGDWLNRVIASAHAAVVGSFCCRAMFSETPLKSVVASAWRFEPVFDAVLGTSATLRWTLPLTLGYFFYDCCVMAIDKEVYVPLMVAHHVISLIVWPMSVLSRRGSVYVLFYSATEISTPLLHLVVFFLPKHKLSDGPHYTVLGVGLLVTFFLARILPIPMVLHSMKATWSFWQPEDAVIFVTWALSVPVPMLLNGFWFFKLVHGALSKLGGEKPKKP
eukprot:TRINITY_DN28086_c0_g2_i1.p1 TRINITY_DN28086_c0_g2~~TRINITY_DN28086_c0_g2_i1.p1  ORF type:complete len:269 (+),score=40.48 TRINITY_DN28086_c0_g2_i1:84-890(+)